MMVESDLKLAEREKVLIESNLLKPTWKTLQIKVFHKPFVRNF